MRPVVAPSLGPNRGGAEAADAAPPPASLAHYRDVFGFTVGFTYGEPVFYAGVERDDVVIHLQAARQTERQVGQGAINIFVTEVDALYEELRARKARVLKAPENYAYGMRDFDLDDLDGNRLTFGMSTAPAK